MATRKHTRYCYHELNCDKDINCFKGEYCHNFKSTTDFTTLRYDEEDIKPEFTEILDRIWNGDE